MADRYVVLDTNVLLSSIITPAGAAARAFQLAVERYRPVVSEATLAEFVSKLWSPKFGKWASYRARGIFLDQVLRLSDFIDPVPPVALVEDPEDDKFLALAKAAEARFLISGDKAVLRIGIFHRAEIVSPGAFVRMHAEPKPDTPGSER